MKISEEVDYMKNELKSYIFLKQYIEELKQKKKYEIRRLKLKIEEITDDINHNRPKSPSLDTISLSSFSNIDKPLALIIKLDDKKEELDKTEKEYDLSIAAAEQRTKHVEDALDKIDEKEKEIIEDLYFVRIGFNEVCEKHGYSRSHLYRIVEKIIKKMVKKP